MDDVEDKKPTVLMVDDDVVINSIISHRLEKMDCHVETFTDPEKFLLRLKESKPSLCIVDININTLGVGYLLIQAIRNAYSKELPIVILSSKAKTDDIAHGLECGANDYIIKPVTRTAFKEKLIPYLTKKDDTQAKELKLKKVPAQLRSGHIQFQGRINSISSNEIIIQSSQLIKNGTFLSLQGEITKEIFTADISLRVTVIKNQIIPDSNDFLINVSVNDENHQEKIKKWISQLE